MVDVLEKPTLDSNARSIKIQKPSDLTNLFSRSTHGLRVDMETNMIEESCSSQELAWMACCNADVTALFRSGVS